MLRRSGRVDYQKMVKKNHKAYFIGDEPDPSFNLLIAIILSVGIVPLSWGPGLAADDRIRRPTPGSLKFVQHSFSRIPMQQGIDLKGFDFSWPVPSHVRRQSFGYVRDGLFRANLLNPNREGLACDLYSRRSVRPESY